MKMWGFVWVSILLLAGTSHTLHSARAYSDKGWERPQPESANPIGPWNDGIAAAQASSESAPSTGESENAKSETPSQDPLQTSVPMDLAASTGLPGNFGASWTREIGPLLDDRSRLAGNTDHSASHLANGVGDVEDWQRAGHQWAGVPQGYSDTGLAGAGGSADLPAFSEVGWTSATLPVQREEYFMELVVFPALGAVTLVCVVILVIARLRRRRAVNEVQHLLHV